MITNEKILINTKRLIMYPLSLLDLMLLIDSPKIYAYINKLNDQNYKFDPETINVIKEKLIPKLIVNTINWEYYTIWLMIEKQSKNIIGSFCYYGRPNRNSEVEIGYGISSDFQNKGFMTEAMNAIIEWCRNKNCINYLIARCKITNHASSKVLMNNGFELVSRNNELKLWRVKT